MRFIDALNRTVLLVCTLAVPYAASSATIAGSFYLQGSAIGTTNGIDFYYFSPGDQKGAIALPTTGSFTDLTAGEVQTINNATTANGVIPGTSFNFANWIQLTDGINLDLTSIPIPDYPVCSVSGAEPAGFSCIANAQSPIILTQRADGVGATLAVYGELHQDGQTDSTPYVGLFTAPSVNFSTISDFEAYYNANGGIPAVGYSANFIAVPEPRWLMVLIGGILALLGFHKKSAPR